MSEICLWTARKYLELENSEATSDYLLSQLNNFSLLASEFLPNDTELQKHKFKIHAFQEILKFELQCILGELASLTTPIVLKGFPLNQQLYGSKLLRFSGDIDLLIPINIIIPTIEKLNLLGYKSKLKIPNNYFSKFAKFQNSLELINETTGIEIDLHWYLIQPGYAKPADYNFLINYCEKSEEAPLFSFPNLTIQMLTLALQAEKDVDSKHRLFELYLCEKKLSPEALKLLLKISDTLACSGTIESARKLAKAWLADETIPTRLNEIQEFKLQLKNRKKLSEKIRLICWRIFAPHLNDNYLQKSNNPLLVLAIIFKFLKTTFNFLKAFVKNLTQAG